MATSLRKRLGRRTGLADLKTGTASEGNSPCSSKTSLDLSPSTSKDPKDRSREPRSVSLDDLRSTPPPDRKLRSSKDFSRDKTPPQLLLERYKSKTAKHALTASTSGDTSVKKPTPSAQWDSLKTGAPGTHRRRKSSSSLSPTDASNSMPLPPSADKGGNREKHNVRGVEFDMLTQSKAGADAARRGPISGESAQRTRHRRTRSSAKKEEADRKRADSVEDELSADMKDMLQLDTSLQPPPLSIRKVERTPSPRAEEIDDAPSPQKSPPRDGLWKSARMFEKQHLSLSPPLPDDKETSVASASPLHPVTHRRHHQRSPNLIDQAVANILSIPLPKASRGSPGPQTISPTASTSSSPSETTSIRTPPNLKKSILKSTSSLSSSTENLTLKVLPPIPHPLSPPGYIFTSTLLGSSRPSEPWSWCRRWTCCACGPEEGSDVGGVGGFRHPGRKGRGKGPDVGGVGAVVNDDGESEGGVAGGEDVERNGRGEARAAVTVAEQRVCSRIACGHVRCPGCWVEGNWRGESEISGR